MTESRKVERGDVLDQETLELLGSAQVRTDLPPQQMSRLRDRLMRRVDDDAVTASPYITIRGGDGPWIETAPLVERKLLTVNDQAGIETYLLRLHPGAELDRHRHDDDELCIVLEGEVSFDEVHLDAGDFHLARKGSWHGRASTVHGALLFLQSGVTTAQVTA